MLFQTRRSVAGSCASTFQKLFTQSVLRVAMMSSYTARTSADAFAYSMGSRLTVIWLTSMRAPSTASRQEQRRWRAPQPAVSIPVQRIDRKPDRGPDDEPPPRVARQGRHETRAYERAAHAGEVRRRHAKAPRELEPQPPQLRVAIDGERHGRGDVQIRVRHHAGEDQRGRDIEHRADREARDDAERHVAARIPGLLRAGGDGIEADESEEDDGGRGDHPAPAEMAEVPGV